MKLYATVTSERASKGQGGNEYLYVKIQGAEPGVATLLDMEIVPDEYGHAHVRKMIGSISLLRSIISAAHEQIEDKRKGERQKGERCKMPGCDRPSTQESGYRPSCDKQ